MKSNLKNSRAIGVHAILRSDGRNHWLVQISSEVQMCKNARCSKQTHLFSSRCYVYLCSNGKQGFFYFHKFKVA